MEVLRLTMRYDAFRWGIPTISHGEHEAACERMTAYLLEHTPHEWRVVVRPTRRGEVDSIVDLEGRTYRESDLPEELREAIGAAWMHACETWDAGGDA